MLNLPTPPPLTTVALESRDHHDDQKSPSSPTHSTCSSSSFSTTTSTTSSIVPTEIYSAGTCCSEKLDPFRLSHDTLKKTGGGEDLLGGDCLLPPTAYYIPNFLSEEKEKDLLKNIYGVNSQQWHRLSNRRLQRWGGNPNDKLMFEEKLPMWLSGNYLGLNDLHVFPGNRQINHVLINEYEINQGIDSHKDGPVYFPMVFILSLESTVILNFKLCEKDEDYVEQCPYMKNFSVIAEPRSLLVFTEDIYHYYMHGIEECEKYEITDDMVIANATLLHNKELAETGYTINRSKRVSMTCRCVRKTAKKNLFFLNKK